MYIRVLFSIFLFNFIISEKTLASEIKNKSAYDFEFKSIDGTSMPLAKFSNKVIFSFF